MSECSAARRLLEPSAARRRPPGPQPTPPPPLPANPSTTVTYPGETGAPAVAMVVGGTAHVTVAVDPVLGQAGLTVAEDCLARAEADWAWLQLMFGAVPLPSMLFVVAPVGGQTDGSGGAYHMGCADTTLVCCVSLADPRRTSALFVAEASEVGQAVQGQGWDCGATNGEGLSRVHAEMRYPGVLDDFETASAWLDSSRPDWISANEATDQDPVSNGCAVLFLTWLISLGHGLDEITQAAASSLAATCEKLTGQPAAGTFKAFALLMSMHWPAGQPSGVITDNPWGPAPPTVPVPPSNPPGPPATPAAQLKVLTTIEPGDYSIVLVPTAVMTELAQAGVNPQVILDLWTLLIALGVKLPHHG
jgi:hypothetical protein